MKSVPWRSTTGTPSAIREADTVLDRNSRDEPVIFTFVERLTGCCVFLRVDSKSATDIMHVMKGLKQQYGENFHQIFQTIISDNDSEFVDFSSLET